MMSHAAPQRIFDVIDPTATPLQRAEQIQQVSALFFALCTDEESWALHDEDLQLLHRWARDEHDAVREAAVHVLLELAVTWDDIQDWLQDTHKGIRTATLYAVSDTWRPINHLCASDKPRCSKLLIETADRFADMEISSVFTDLVHEDAAWLTYLWPGIEQLLDENREELNSLIGVGFLEHIIVEQNWGVDAPYLSEWITGNHPVRQYILLKIAAWMGLHEGRLREITQALTSSHDPEISRIAEGILHGKITYADF